jgi:putative hydrolase of the HAD superfamily
VRRPEVVFLDVGDTLIRAHPSWAAVYSLGLADVGIAVDESDVERALLEETKTGWWLRDDPFEPTEEVSYERIKAFDSAVLARVGHADLPDTVFRSIEAAFGRRSAWYVYPDVLPSIKALSAAGVRLGVISNFVWGGPELIHDLELAQHLESLTISARIGFQKPNRAIFEHALAQMRVDPAHAMHIGDSYKADVTGARQVGMTAVLIDRYGADPARLREEHGDPDLIVITDLLELLDLFAIERPAAVTAPA